ncbi:MAG: hypothetical protein V3S16_00525 [Candidatus Desulfatibia sp.]|uniref:hypothetical protein n=1 Tax=Candidatus Desulfatibia sp. TaxID=3101189 RepID=UPI002F346EDC
MKSSLWVVIVVVALFTGFLIGYSVSSYTGFQKIGQGLSGGTEAGGYGGETGGYGADTGGYGTETVESIADAESYGERSGFYGE